MTTERNSTARRLFVWGETPQRRLFVENRLARTLWRLTPVLHVGEELVKTITANQPAGIIFCFNNLDLMLEVLRLMEGQAPGCCRFVVCSSRHEACLRAYRGLPPSILREDGSIEAWNDKLRRSILLNGWLMRPEFRAALTFIREIPSLPESHRRIVEVLRDPDFHMNDVATLISQDVAITLQLLKLVNSAALGLAQPVRTVSDAVRLLGISRVQALVMSAWAFFFTNSNVCPGFSPDREWQHALAVAETTQRLAQELRVSSVLKEDAFTAGLLHDVGKVLLAANHPERYSAVLASAKKQGIPLYKVEMEHLGYTHAELGGGVLGMWGLALPQVEAVALHHQPEPGPEAPPSVRSLVCRANRTARELAQPVQPAPRQFCSAG